MASTSNKDLPEEIITQILYCVPAKSIGRFRSVSKGWLSLLTHPDFIKTHDQNTLINKHRLIFNTTDNSKIKCPGLYSNPYDEPILTISDIGLDEEIRRYNCNPYLTIHGSCNGLVMVSAKKIAGNYVHFLLNPTTKESMKLPEISDYSYMNDYKLLDYVYTHGFGYDSETGDFKFVSLTCLYCRYLMPSGRMFVHVYSLRRNNWRLLTDTLDGYLCIFSKYKSAVFVDGFLHWLTEKTVNGLPQIVILAFSLADEKFSEVPTPEFVQSAEYLSSDCDCYRLVGLDGKLAFFHEMEGKIWLMNEYKIKESWIKISLHGIPLIPKVTPHDYNKPMVFCHDGKFMVANSDRMMVYDDEKETFEETVCVWDREKFKVYGSYVESLVSIASCIEH